jgi:hypothetical protein
VFPLVCVGIAGAARCSRSHGRALIPGAALMFSLNGAGSGLLEGGHVIEAAGHEIVPR